MDGIFPFAVPSVYQKVPVGATLGRPQILPKQNLSPSGEMQMIFLRKNPKIYVFRRAIADRPYD